MFREQVKMDRSSLGLINADNRPVVVSYITIHRNSLLSDSYAELAGISSRCLKGVIRVKFINEQVTIICVTMNVCDKLYFGSIFYSQFSFFLSVVLLKNHLVTVYQNACIHRIASFAGVFYKLKYLICHFTCM